MRFFEYFAVALTIPRDLPECAVTPSPPKSGNWRRDLFENYLILYKSLLD